MARTTRKHLETLVKRVTEKTGGPHVIDSAYGAHRLNRIVDMDSRAETHVSPRLPAGQLADWMRAYLQGLSDAERFGC